MTSRPRALRAMTAFSVPVTEGSSRKTSAPLRCCASSRKPPLRVTSAPRASKARKWVSMRRRPITSPPGGGRLALPKRASKGPARSSDARIRSASSRSTCADLTHEASTVTTCSSSHRTSAPSELTSSSRVSTSRIRGMLPSVTGSDARTVAAMAGKAGVLVPGGSGASQPGDGRPLR